MAVVQRLLRQHVVVTGGLSYKSFAISSVIVRHIPTKVVGAGCAIIKDLVGDRKAIKVKMGALFGRFDLTVKEQHIDA